MATLPPGNCPIRPLATKGQPALPGFAVLIIEELGDRLAHLGPQESIQI
jgi:hypothetical protein